MSNNAEARGERLRNGRFLRTVERVGNRMVQPMTLFGILCMIVVVLSVIGSVFGWSATGEMYDNASGTVQMTTVEVYNLLSRDGITYMFSNFVSNVISYSPLGVMLVHHRTAKRQVHPGLEFEQCVPQGGVVGEVGLQLIDIAPVAVPLRRILWHSGQHPVFIKGVLLRVPKQCGGHPHE